MKYFAILKDSIREARDSKVLLVLLILSTIVSLLVATVAFEPRSAERTFAQFFRSNNPGGAYVVLMVMIASHEPDKLEQLKKKQFFDHQFLVLKKVELLRGDPDSPLSDYALTVTGGPRAETTAEGEEKVRKIFQDETPLNLLQIGEVKRVSDTDEPNGDVYRVTVHGNRDMVRFWSVEPSILFGAIPMEHVDLPMGIQLYILARIVIGIGSWIAVLAAVIITSFFIPNMLRKGAVDMLLVKPIHRPVLLLYKYLGGLIFMILCTTYAIVSIWLVLGLRTGLWGNEALLLIPSLTFFFAILYAISTLISVLTRAAVPTILVTIGAWAVIFVLGQLNGYLQGHIDRQERIEQRPANMGKEEELAKSEPTVFARVMHVIYLTTPRTGELNYINDMLVYSSFVTGDITILGRLDPKQIVWWESLLVSGGWIAFFLLISCWWFATKDY